MANSAVASLVGNLGPSASTPLQGGTGALQGSSGAGLQPAASPIGAALGAAKAPVSGGGSTGGGAITSGGSSTNPYNINQPQLLAGLQQEYGSTIANAQAQVPEYQQIEQNMQNNAVTQAQQQTQDENNNYTAANNAYNTQNQATQSQQQLSLAELADQIHGQNTGLINQLGTLGAGSSSAVGTGQNALAKVQNTDRANIQQQAGAGTAEIQAAQQSLLQQHQSNLDQIQQYKTNQLANIVGTYGPLIQNVETQIGTASGEERARLAEYDVTLQQQAGTALQQLDSDISNLTNATVAKSNEALSNLTVNPAPTAVSVPTVSPFNVGNQGNTANTTAAPTAPSGGSVYDLMNQNAPATP
jgi:hypothetical protein